MAKGLVLIATFAVIGFVLDHLGLRDALDTHWIDSEVKGQGLRGDVLFVLIGALAVCVGLPRQGVCFLAGYAFGFAEGLLWSSLASLIGCVITFFYARLMGRNFVTTRYPERVARLDAFLAGNAFAMTLLIRLLPVGSNLVTNLAAGVAGVRPMPFFLGSMLGYLPQTVVFALLGSGIQVDPVFRIGASVVLFVTSGVMGVWLFRRFRHGRHLDAATEAVIEDDGEATNEQTR
ncbi:putative membrane protein [Paramagnetospirillum magnetotacticum MS-1]|uniref:TVP38/TMEM64 family membrane protein n=2 Tax=Paramagnetospirillum magnetotacticum TaxID=188 RepID=A0A0C2YQX6_PARME|nr:putative membrane protein [Paramagnetospirillum magnetotacticum MS-1]